MSESTSPGPGLYSDNQLAVDYGVTAGRNTVTVAFASDFTDSYPTPDPNAIRRAAVVLINTVHYEATADVDPDEPA
jgi:hypothetical protein